MSPTGFDLYARVSSHDQKADLDRQVTRLSKWAAKTGQPAVRVEAEVGSGMNDVRPLVARSCAFFRTLMSGPWSSSTGIASGG
ncbi:MAG: recombinase family protein [Acidimicrobiales bacterium]